MGTVALGIATRTRAMTTSQATELPGPSQDPFRWERSQVVGLLDQALHDPERPSLAVFGQKPDDLFEWLLERIFGQKPDDLFEWLLERLPELPRPAKSRKHAA